MMHSNAELAGVYSGDIGHGPEDVRETWRIFSRWHIDGVVCFWSTRQMFFLLNVVGAKVYLSFERHNR
jgi:hypothetical protein